MLFEGVDHINESVGNVSFGGVIVAHIDGEGSSVVIGGIIVPFGGFSINVLGWVILG